MNPEHTSKRLTRRSNDKILGGVCSGLADYFNLDATLVRVLAALAAVFSLGTAVVAYVVAWALMPTG